MQLFSNIQRAASVAEVVRLSTVELSRVKLRALSASVCFLLSVSISPARAADDDAQVAYFERHIRPVLVNHCYACHSAKAVATGKLKAGLQLDTRAGIRAGGESGPAVVPGDVDASLLVDALRHESFEMPPTGKLPQTVIDHFVVWIKNGAVDPRDGTIQSVESKVDVEAGRSFWAFRPLRLPEVPRVNDKSWLRMDVVDEQIDTIGKAFMGLTLGCARCHDHKFDPISTRDYYALAGIFRNTTTLSDKRKGGPITQCLEVKLPGSKNDLTPGVAEQPKPADSPIFIRGNKDRPGTVVPRGYPAVLATPDDPPVAGKQSGRKQLTEWLTDPQHPLTARVYVNRVWHHLMGAGLVPTPDNFGSRGQQPTHPELLDFLAVTFVEDGWSTKQLIRRIVLSRVYQQSSRTRDATEVAAWKRANAADPENHLLWRQHRRRLDAESLRDALLAVSGQLDRKQFGNTLTFSGRLAVEKQEQKVDRNPWLRRSVYLPRYREAYENDLMKVFDMAHPALVTGRRSVTNVPTQALLLMNSPMVMEQSQHVAAAIFAADEDDAARLKAAYRKVLGRAPTEEETQRDLKLLQEAQAALEQSAAESALDHSSPAWNPSLTAWACVCQTLLVSNEFLFVD